MPQQPFTWRREARKRAEAEALTFVPAIVAPELIVAKEPKPSGSKRCRPRRGSTTIEVEAEDVMVRICDGASPTPIPSFRPFTDAPRLASDRLTSCLCYMSVLHDCV
jgi:hypothetical protein